MPQSISPETFYVRLEKETIACPLCGRGDERELLVGDRYGMGLRTVLCPHDGFVFTNPRPTPDALERFYRDDYRAYYFSHPDPAAEDYRKSPLRERAQLRARWLLDFYLGHAGHGPGRGLRILDVGCGDGAMLSACRERFPDAELFGIEPTPAYAAFAAESAGAKVYAESVSNAADAHRELAGSADLVVLSHVLEHLCDPVGMLRALGLLLKPEGRLLVEVPNLASPIWKRFSMFHIAHINHFVPNTMEIALARAGYRVEREFAGIHPADPWAMTFLARRDVNASPMEGLCPPPETLERFVQFVHERVKDPKSDSPRPGIESPPERRGSRLRAWLHGGRVAWRSSRT